MSLSLRHFAVLTVLPAVASAQFNNEWVTFHKDTSQLGPDFISSQTIETDFAWGDLDHNGFTDLVVARKQPFTSAGKRANLLLMNFDGVLVDYSTSHTSSDVEGDLGFKTITNDRDVILADVNMDGWDDVITATTLSDGDPKHIGHPRIYINLGNDTEGNWLGLEHQDARMPQLLHYGTGLPENPRFCSVAAGDVTGNGYPDLYFGDYDSSGAGGEGQPANKDLNDRLLINDGTGHFTDQSQSRMSNEMLLSAFGNSVEMHDINQDGVIDVLKDTALNFPQRVSVSYNNPADEGQFNLFDPFHTNAPYHMECGDLNNDGRLDVLVSDDGLDRYRYNLGNDALGRVIWGSAMTFEFLSGQDDGFGSNNLIADLDGDGWNDALIADVDVDIGGYNRRLHIYHNPGGEVGEEIRLREERQSTNPNGWLGAVGLHTADLRGTHDVAVFDIENDGDLDMIISQNVGSSLWINETTFCQEDLGSGGPGTATLSLCGHGLGTGQSSTLKLNEAPVGEFYLIGYSTVEGSLPFAGGTIVAFPVVGFVDGVVGATGTVEIPVDGGLGAIDIYMQAIVSDASQAGGWQISNAVKAEFQP